MFDKWLKLPAHYYLKITALVILTVGICLHNTLMSIGAIWIVANWLIEADFINYWKRFKSSPTVWMLLGILILALLSLMWSDDVAYGQKDLARKMPFFAIPFALGLGKPIEKKIIYFILYVFIGILLLTSGINYYRYFYVLEDPPEIRHMSFFVSHIRFSVSTVLGVLAGVYLIYKRKGPAWIWLISVVWILFYIWKSQILSGYVLLILLSIFSVIYLIVKMKQLKWKAISAGLMIIGAIGCSWMFINVLSSFQSVDKISVDDLELKTPSGRNYFHDLNSTETQNGNYVWIYMQQEEVENEWNRRSEIAYDTCDRKGQPMFGSILRYMTSKAMRKDSVRVWELSEAEITKIENGCTSANENTGFKAKLQEFIYQWDVYQAGGDPNGHSLLQRVEHLKIAWSVVAKKWLTGVGIGDVPNAFDEEYVASGSLLLDENRHRSHNQFLTIWISHGILGTLMLFGMLVIPAFKKKKMDYFQWAVLLTLFISLLFQDMLETQAGVTLFGLFYGLVVYKEAEPSLSSAKSVFISEE